MAAEEAENASEDMEAVEAEVTVAETEATDRKDAKVAAARTGDKTEVGIRVKPHPTFKEIYNITLEDGAKRLGTKNLTPSRSVYNERLIKFKGEEYRVWDAFRSKLAGAIIKGLQTVPIVQALKFSTLAQLQAQHQAISQTSWVKRGRSTASNLPNGAYAT
jgi:hypothetical protein